MPRDKTYLDPTTAIVFADEPTASLVALLVGAPVIRHTYTIVLAARTRELAEAMGAHP